MVDLVLLLEAAQDRDRVLDARLAHVHRLEAPLERGVLLDVLAVLVERRRADGVQLAARERGLEHVARVHRALGGAGAHDRVQLVDEQDDAALGLLDLAQHRLQAVLELAAVLRAGDHRRQVERDDVLVAQRSTGTSPATMRCASPSTIAVLPVPGSPMSTGLFLVRRDSTWIDAADLLVAADDRVELAVARGLGEVAAEALERLELRLGVLVGDLRAARAAPRAPRCSRAAVAPARSRTRPASPLSAASATSRCSVET